MRTHYIHVPYAHEPWQFDWVSCLLFIMSLLLLALYVIMPGISLEFALISVTSVAALGVISAVISIASGAFWLLKIYATCGLIGNIGVLLWMLLSLC